METKKVNPYIVCPDEIKTILLEDADGIVNSLMNMVAHFGSEKQLEYLKKQFPKQLLIQMVKAWHNENNQRARLNDIIREKDNKIKDLETSLQRQVR